MHAAIYKGSGRRRLLILLVSVIATAAVLSLGLSKAFAVINQPTSATLALTDSNGQPITGAISPTEQVTLTVTVTGSSAAPFGTFSLATTTDGSNFTNLCDGNGTCSWTVNPTGGTTSQASMSMFLPAGAYNIRASFRGSLGAGFSNSSSGLVAVNASTVVTHNTATTLTASPATITAGGTSTLTATVSAVDQSGTPSGTVLFYNLQGGEKTLIGQGTLDANGQTMLTKSDWPAGTMPLEADYLGVTYVDNSGNTVKYNPSNGAASLTANPAVNPQVVTTTTVTAVPNILRSDQLVHITAQIAQVGSSTESLASSILIRAQTVGLPGSVPIATVPVGADGFVALDAHLNPGTYIIEADYFGNLFYQASTGFTEVLQVNPATPSTTTYIHDSQTYVGDTATLAARVLDGHTGLPVPAGEQVVLTASNPAATSCVGVTDGSGVAACTVQFSSPGTFGVTASYAGDTTYDPSTGLGQITVLQVPTSVKVAASPNPVPTGVSDKLTGNLTDSRTGTPIAGKTLTLQVNGNETCTAGPTDALGNASCSVTLSEGAGTYQTSVSFTGDGPSGEYLASSNTGSLGVVASMPTNWTYTGTTTVYAGQPATLRFVLADGSGQVMANRNVTLSLNGTSYPVTTNANGVATQAITAPATAGSYTPTASYGGEPGYLASTGNGSLQVNTIPTALAYTGSKSVFAGASATISFVLTDGSDNALAGQTVTLGLPGGGSYIGTTDANGVVSDTITAPTPSVDTAYTPTASFGGSLPYDGSTGSGTLNVNVVPTTITYAGATSANAGQPAQIAFVLTNSTNSQVLANMPVTLTLPDGSQYPTTTDGSGVASVTVNAPTSTGSFPVSMSFAGQAQYLPSKGYGALVVTTIPTSVTYVGDTSVYQGGTATLAAKLLDNSGNPIANKHLTLTLSTGETCSGITNASGIASCQVVVSEPTTLAGQPYGVAISFGGDLPYLPSTGNGALAVVAQYAAPAAGFCSTHKCESMIANPTVVSPTQLQVLYTDDSVLPTAAAQAPTAVLDGGQQLVVNVTPTSGQTPSYVDTYGGSTATKNQDFVNVSLPANLAPGTHTVRVFIYDGDGDWDQWTWTIAVGSNGSVGTANPGPGQVTCGAPGIKCESLLADPAVVSNSQLSIVAMDDSAIPMTGANAPSATLNGQPLGVSVSPTSGQPQNYVDSTGGSLATTHQALITINLPASLAPGSYSILVTAYDGDGDLNQWSWPITVASNGTVTSNAPTGGGAGTQSATSTITGTFANAVNAGNTLWLTNTTKVTALPAAGATITFTNQTVTVGSTTYSLPDAEVQYSPSASTATTVWDPVNQEWDTIVPKALGGNIFASGFGVVVPVAIPKNTRVTWSATISSDTPKVTVAWQWAAAAYTSFNADPSQLGIKPCDDGKASSYANPDKAGTPESYKAYVTAGGTGAGGPNFTGNFTPATNIKF